MTTIASTVRPRIARVLALAATAFVLFSAFATPARASSKDECIEAHSRGQDLRERGQVVRARQLFLTCAQPSCPALVQGDCARFGEETARLVPTVSFGARDSSGSDLPGTTVIVDDVILSNRLDDGRSFELDPGRHTVRFLHDGKETQLHVVLNQGEKGRAIVATFPSDDPPKSAPDAKPDAPPAPHRSAFPLVVAGLGGATLATGAALIAIGFHEVPANCSTSTHECAAPPGDPTFAQAAHGMNVANAGTALAIGGGAVFVGGLVWYFLQSPAPAPTQVGARSIAPWVGQGSGGVAVSGAF